MALKMLLYFIKNRTYSFKTGASLLNKPRLTYRDFQRLELGPLHFIIYLLLQYYIT